MQLILHLLNTRNPPRSLTVRRFPCIIGRQSTCDLRITSSMVSRRHCVILERDGVLILNDLNSSNGTRVNGDKVAAERILRPGDTVQIGNFVFEVEYSPTGSLGPAYDSDPTTVDVDTRGSNVFLTDSGSGADEEVEKTPKPIPADQAPDLVSLDDSDWRPAGKTGSSGSIQDEPPMVDF